MDRELIEVVIEIFLDTIVPYLETIDSWFIENPLEQTDESWSYDTNQINLPKFLKPMMAKILQIRKSLLVIRIIKQKLMINYEKILGTSSSGSISVFKEIMKRIKENVILHKSTLNLDKYELTDIKPEILYHDKRYNVSSHLQDASQIQKKMWKLHSIETHTERGVKADLMNAPFSYNHIKSSELKYGFGIPLISSSEIIHDEGCIVPRQETYGGAMVNQMSYANSAHQEKLEEIIKNYQNLKNYSEDELKVYSGAMRYYQDYITFEHYLSEYQDESMTSDHYFYFKTSTLDSFIKECILNPIKIKAKQVGELFNQTLIKDFKLEKAFEFVRKIYFMEAGKDMAIFCTQLFDRLDMYDKCDDEVLINGILQE